MKHAAVLLLLVGTLGLGCNTPTPTEPSDDPTVATTEIFVASIGVGGSSDHTFSVQSANTLVKVTLASVSNAGTGEGLSSEVKLEVGASTADGCTMTSTATVAAGLTAQVSTTVGPGTYCLRMTDPGSFNDTTRVVVRVNQGGVAGGETKTETFTSNLTAQGTVSRTFGVGQDGSPVQITLSSLTPAVPVSLQLGIVGLATSDCHINTAIETLPGSGAQISTTVDGGYYCVRIADIGNLTITAPALFTINVTHR